MIASIIIAVFAIVILYLTRSNIIDLLDRDIIMYDKNFEIKKECLHEAFNCLDLVAQNGVEIKMNAQFITRAKQAYNGLLCTLSSAKLYQDFYRMAIDTNTDSYSVQDIENFKIACRGELISKRRKTKEGFKGSTNGTLDTGIPQTSSVKPQVASKPQVRPAQPAQRPTQPTKPQ